VSKLSERQRLILTIAVTVLITGGLLALIFKDRTEIEATNDEITTLDTRIRAAEVEIRKTRDREDKVLVYRAVEERELAVLPTKQEIANFHRDLSLYLAQAGLRFQELPESTPVESSLSKGIFVTRTVLTCGGESSALLRFLNMIENDERLVSVKGLKVKAGGRHRSRVDASDGKPQHDIEVHLETYFYNPESKTVIQNKIPGEESRLQEEKIKDAIAQFQPERPESYVLRPSTSRRDPMTDPRRARQTEDPAELERVWQREEAVVLDLERRVEEILEKVEQAKALLEVGDLFRYDRVDREIEVLLNDVLARLAHVEQMKLVTIPDLAMRIEVVKGKLEEVRSTRKPRSLRVTREVAEATLADAQQAFETGKYNEVTQLASQWVLYLDGKEIEPDARSAVAAISALRPRARIYSDFQSIPLRVTGTIVHPVDPKMSVAVINGRPRHMGDRLDESGDVIVGRISRVAVEFQYKGETIRIDRGTNSGKRRAAAPSRGSGPVPTSAQRR